MVIAYNNLYIKEKELRSEDEDKDDMTTYQEKNHCGQGFIIHNLQAVEQHKQHRGKYGRQLRRRKCH